MLAVLALLAFAPVQERAPSGPPAPHLSRDLAAQWRFDNGAAWRAFQAKWGPGWAARWDERTGLPRFLYAPGIPASQTRALLLDLARLAGISAAELRQSRSTSVRGRSVRQWTRTVRGAPVEGDQIAIVTQGGQIQAVWLQITPIPAGPQPQAGEVWLPLGRPDLSTSVRGVLATRTEEGPLVVYRDRDGAVLSRYDQRHFGSGQVSHRERTIGDAMLTHPAREVTVTDGSSTVTTDSAGAHTLTSNVSVTLTGPALTILRNGAAIAPIAGSSNFTLTGGGNVSQATAMVLHHYHTVRDWLYGYWPTHPLHSMTVQANVDMASACNAYYSSGTINFYAAGGPCYNFGEIADVIYHETGHGIHHYLLVAGTFAGDVSEGSADFVSATILNDTIIGKNATTSGGSIRDLAPDRVYPTDVNGEVHNDGLIWGSFLWNLREQWSAAYGAAAGVAMTDRLFLTALSYGPTLTDLYDAVLLADDDNGNLSDGTPHACELVTLLDHHGIGPGPIGVVSLAHTPLGPQSSDAAGYPVSFDLYDLTRACSGVDYSSIKLFYTLDEGPLSTGDTGADAEAAAFTEVPLTQAGSTFSGTIPRAPATSHIRYYMEVRSTDGSQIITTHDGDEGQLYGFYVGDREVVWCEDFEAGAPAWTHGGGLPEAPSTSYTDQWQIGAPVASTFDPAAAYAGAAIAGTNLAGNYLPNNQQYLQSPVVDSGGAAPMLLYSFARRLTVEDGIYDVATMRINDEVVFTNGSTAAGTRHLLDADWTLQETPLAPYLGADGKVRFTYTLSSDPGLEFGGWSIDQACVLRLADVPGHYRVGDLVATDDEDAVTITWTQPWMAPLSSTALVRKRDGYPASIDDGLIVDLDLSASPGEARVVVDADAQPGEVFHYALFAAGATDEDWYNGVVEGENADQGGVPALPDPVDTSEPTDDTAAPDTAASPDDSDPPAADADPGGHDGGKSGGCATTPGAGLALALGALALASRRQRRR